MYTQKSNLDIREIWAKSENKNQPKQSLLSHSINAGMTSKVLLKESSLSPILEYIIENTGESEEKILNFIGYITAMHDIGKCHPVFQQKDEKAFVLLVDHKLSQTDNELGVFRHELYSEELVEKYLKAKGYSGRQLAYIRKVISMHHEGRTGCNKEIKRNITAEWSEIQDKIESIISKIFKIEYIDLSKSKHVDGLYMAILGIVVVSDWLSSDYYFNASSFIDKESIGTYIKWSYKTAKLAVKRSGLSNHNKLNEKLSYNDIWEFIKTENDLRPIQKETKEIFENHVGSKTPNLMIIEAPMGEGKTEAALYSALKMSKGKRGIYVALPTSATSNQMYIRVNEIFNNIGSDQAKLLHSMSWLIEYQLGSSRTDIDSWLNSTRRGLLSNSAVGTIDQAMLSVMTVKYSILRLMGLAGKVLIIDEVHAYDAYMSGVIERLLEWCSILKVPVIMLSATLPKDKKNQFINAYMGNETEKLENEMGKAFTEIEVEPSLNYPLITYANTEKIFYSGKIESFIKSRVQVEILRHSSYLRQINNLVSQVNDQGGCIAIILNTVDEVQKVYMQLQQRVNLDVDLMIFHARMPASQRARVEKEVMSKFGKGGGVTEDNPTGKNKNRPAKSIIVSTQVLEQSLDVDFDWIITSVAPIDLILQRLGRGHRHENVQRPLWLQTPKITVLAPEDNDYGTTGLIYAPVILDRTLEVLSRYETISIPENMRELVDIVYTIEMKDKIGKHHKELYEYINGSEDLSNIGKNLSLNSPDKSRFGLYSGTHVALEEDSTEGSMAVARTRYGEQSRRIAFIEEQTLINLGFNINGIVGRDSKGKLLDPPNMNSKELAEMILEQSLSIPAHNISEIPDKHFSYPIDGDGLLKGLTIFPTKWGIYQVEHERIYGYRVDETLGIIIERKWAKK